MPRTKVQVRALPSVQTLLFCLPVLFVVFAAAAPATAQMVSGENNLLIAPSEAAPGTLNHVVEIVGVNNADVKGYSIVVNYGLEYLEAVAVNIDGTLAEAVGAEFVNYENYESEGFFIFAVLLDLLPPYAGQVIPGIPDFELVYANFVCNVLPSAAEVDEIPLVFVNDVGTPPVSNIFVIDFDSISPNLISGAISVIGEVAFVRGDTNLDTKFNIADAVTILSYLHAGGAAPDCLSIMDINDDGMITQSDPIYELNYLFLSGPSIPAPFPLSGLDPTADGLSCE
ncbi:MAG: hypothetical protein ACKVX7_15325 [Planctomycetota bacterium]